VHIYKIHCTLFVSWEWNERSSLHTPLVVTQLWNLHKAPYRVDELLWCFVWWLRHKITLQSINRILSPYITIQWEMSNVTSWTKYVSLCEQVLTASPIVSVEWLELLISIWNIRFRIAARGPAGLSEVSRDVSLSFKARSYYFHIVSNSSFTLALPLAPWCVQLRRRL
jgi:hypothetical protein